MGTLAWAASPKGHLHGRGGAANVWMIDGGLDRPSESLARRAVSARGHPQTLVDEVRQSPRGRWRPSPRPSTEPSSEASQIDHYGTSKRGTIAGELQETAHRRGPANFSNSGFGGPDLPMFRNLETAFPPKAQTHLRQRVGQNPRNLPSGSEMVEDIVRKVGRPLDAYRLHSKSRALEDTSRRLDFARPPADLGLKGQDNMDMIQPGTKVFGLAVRQPPSMRH